jgi:hypothetical protein
MIPTRITSCTSLLTWYYSLLMSRNYDEWAKMVAQIKKSYPLAQQYLEKVYVTRELQGV